LNTKIIVGLVSIAALTFVGFAQDSGPGSPDYSQKEQRLVELAEGDPAPANASARRGKRGPRGPRGPRGIAGAVGPQGAKGTFGSIVSVQSSPVFLCGFFEGSCSINTARAFCPAGTKITGGGYSGAGIRAFISAPVGDSWWVSAANESEFSTTFTASAVCAS